MDINPWGQEIVESFKTVDIINLYANEESPGMYGDIDTTEERLRQEHPDMGDKLMKGFGIIWHTTGMSPDSSKDWYDTIEEASAYAKELEEEIRFEQKIFQEHQPLQPRKVVEGEPMTAGQLRDLLNKLFQQNPSHDDLILGIVTEDAVAEGYVVGVKHVSVGFDWEMGRLVIQPEERLLTMKLIR